MVFRPLPVLTAVCILALALLLTLGTWQVRRAEWKTGVVEAMQAREGEAPAELRDAMCAPQAHDGAAVRLDGALGPDRLRMYGPGPRGEAGWMILQAKAGICAGRARFIPVQVAFETLDGARMDAPETLVLQPWPEAGTFTPQNDPARGEYYRFDADALGASLTAPPFALVPYWARWEARPVEERVSVTPATHVGYAITWYGLAVALIGVWLALHVRAGRLSWNRHR